MRKALVLGLISTAAVLGNAPFAGAHNELEPSEAAPGTTIELTLKVENERADAGTNRVELYFPKTADVPIIDVPVVAGWTSSVEQPPAQPQTRVIWQGGPATEDFMLPLTIGPLPTTEGRLQFKVLQTYDNGEIDRWIQEWRAGTPEPDMPGPVLDLKRGAVGTVPDSTATPTSTATTTVQTAPTSSSSSPATTTGGSDSGVNGGTVAAIVAAIVAVAGLGLFAVSRARARRRSQ